MIEEVNDRSDDYGIVVHSRIVVGRICGYNFQSLRFDFYIVVFFSFEDYNIKVVFKTRRKKIRKARDSLSGSMGRWRMNPLSEFREESLG